MDSFRNEGDIFPLGLSKATRFLVSWLSQLKSQASLLFSILLTFSTNSWMERLSCSIRFLLASFSALFFSSVRCRTNITLSLAAIIISLFSWERSVYLKSFQDCFFEITCTGLEGQQEIRALAIAERGRGSGSVLLPQHGISPLAFGCTVKQWGRVDCPLGSKRCPDMEKRRGWMKDGIQADKETRQVSKWKMVSTLHLWAQTSASSLILEVSPTARPVSRFIKTITMRKRKSRKTR